MFMADAKTSYTFNACIYTGKVSDRVGLTENEREFNVPTQSIIRL